MAEISKLETIDMAHKTMAIVRFRIDKISKDEIITPISAIDSGAFDDYVMPHGKWPDSEEDHHETVAMELN